MFPTNSECLIGISDAFSAFVYGYPSSCPLYPQQKRDYSALHLYIQAMPVGTYQVQSPGFPKIIYYLVREIKGELNRRCNRDENVEDVCFYPHASLWSICQHLQNTEYFICAIMENASYNRSTCLLKMQAPQCAMVLFALYQ